MPHKRNFRAYSRAAEKKFIHTDRSEELGIRALSERQAFDVRKWVCAPQ